MQFSSYGEKYTHNAGIVRLMDDLGRALLGNPDMLMLGGGAPGRIAEVEQVFQQHLQVLTDDREVLHELLGSYQEPKGSEPVRRLLAAKLKADYGWDITADHIALTNGGQSAFGILANMLCGRMPDGSHRKLLFPICPEYLGYADISVMADTFVSQRPAIEMGEGPWFKYHIDFDNLLLDENAGALCVSRPTNPSGNVMSDAEIRRLDAVAAAKGVPLILDAAYGHPFPGIVYNEATAYWSDNVILMLSMSKLGMPGTRSGILVARPEIIEAFSRANTILNLASSNLGPVMLQSLMEKGDLDLLCRTHIRPWYEKRRDILASALVEHLGDVPFHIHRAEGAFFLWLWFPGLPVSDQMLYEKLKTAGVLVIPGNTAFIGLQEDWEHSHQCLRLSYALEEGKLVSAAAIIGRTVKQLLKQWVRVT
jgi:valine--pyruvate aminotransferase